MRDYNTGRGLAFVIEATGLFGTAVAMATGDYESAGLGMAVAVLGAVGADYFKQEARNLMPRVPRVQITYRSLDSRLRDSSRD
ncbi:hypothetical protein HOA92_06035 [archaeon]|jgi:hypothetical protein|nr:hypothetical protein [archaeon]MBT6762570.1 hypothetical protein [archaeon]